MNEIMEEGIIEEISNPKDSTKNLNELRSEAGKKAWETRRKNKEATKVVPGRCGITEGQSQHLRNLTSFVFDKREGFAAAEQELRDAEQALSAFIESITAK